MKRRDFVRTMCYGGIATFGLPVVNFAQVAQHGRFVFILLRGGFDGLAALVPYGDPEYRSTTRLALHRGCRHCGRCGTPASSRPCTRWPSRIARAVTSTARQCSRPDSIARRVRLMDG